MNAYSEVERAILLLGHKPDENGQIQEGARIRANLAAQLYYRGVAPVIIPSGWYWPKNEKLRKFRESVILKEYLLETYGDIQDNDIMLEPYSTSVPENLLFTRVMFPNLRHAAIVAGRWFEPRVRFLAQMIFGDAIQFEYWSCDDGLSDEQNEARLLRDLKCIVEDIGMEPGDISPVRLPSLEDGTLQSRWPQLNKDHHSCPVHYQ